MVLSLCPMAMAENAAVPATEGVGTSYTGSSFYNTAFAFVQFDADGKVTDCKSVFLK